VILYTVMPEEFVLAGIGHGVGDAVDWPCPPVASGLVECAARGRSGSVRLLVEPASGGGWQVSRLLSSDPADYLDPRFGPGRRVDVAGLAGPAIIG